MRTLTDLFNPAWNEPLVWTLIHSLWQGLIITVVLLVLLRSIPSRYSSGRYVLAASALALIFLCSIGTYVYLMPGSAAADQSLRILREASQVSVRAAESITLMDSFINVRQIIQSNSYFITVVWMTGAFFFSLRMGSGFIYISTIRKNAKPLGEEWLEKLQQLASQIDLKRTVALAESSDIHVPVVIGYFKPLILLPTGMISGLSTLQLESILMHELMHIRRNDYLVNIIQSFLEALFFFNPFVWVISSAIRREREHCCDDAVVKHSSALAYAHALVQLEELHISNSGLAMSLAENKNQLLKRIKRIMEKSAQNYSVRERIVPVLLLVVGIVCTSWLTIKSPSGEHNNTLVISGDTIKPTRMAAESRKEVTLDEQGRPVVDISRSVEYDQEEWSVADFEFDEPIEVPELVEIAEMIELTEMGVPVPPIPGIPPVKVMIPMDMSGMMNFTLDGIMEGDTLIPHGHNWEDFSADFQLKFQEQFGDFYKKHGEEIQKMMEEMGDNFKAQFDENWAASMHENASRHRELAFHQAQRQKEMMEHQVTDMQRMREKMRYVQQDQQEHMEKLKEEMKHIEVNLRDFEKELKAELVKDGYVKSDERISDLTWNNDGSFEVNGKKIKDSDLPKYKELKRKFFKDGGHFRYVE